MNSTGLREKAVLASIGMVVLYAVAALVWFLKMDITSKQGEWNRAQRRYREACRKYRAECKLISEKRDWEERYEDEKSAMPTPDGTHETDTTWMQKIREIAAKHHIEISNSKASSEIAAGDVFEREIECSWEGSLESLVKFMHELENGDGGMFDFHVLSFKPSSKAGYLKGTFAVTCAYMREG